MKKSNFHEVFTKFWRADKGYVITIFISKIKDIPRPLIYALCTKFLINELNEKTNIRNITFVLFIILLAEVIANFYEIWVNNRYSLKKHEEISKILMSDFMKNISKIQLEYFESPDLSNKISLATNELLRTYFYLFTCYVDTFVSVVSMLILITFVFNISRNIIIVSAIVLILYFITSHEINKIKLSHEKLKLPLEKAKRYFANTLSEYDDIVNIRYHMCEDYFVDKWTENADKIIDIVEKLPKKFWVYELINSNLFPIFQYATIAYTAYIVWNGSITVGSFSALLQAIISFINQLKRCSEISLYMNKYSSNLKIIREIDQYIPEYGDDTNKAFLDTSKAHTIEFKNLSFSYGQSKNKILNDVSFKINPGEKVAIVGHNGCGKSTLIKLILRLYEPPENTIFIDNIDIRRYDLKSLRTNFSVVMQNQPNYAVTILENIILKKCTSGKDAKNVINSLKNALLYDKVSLYSEGLYSSVTKMFDSKGICFSGGENQKLNMSRFFNKNASILILDEYYKWLDCDSNRKIFENILKFAKNKTLVIITHDKKILRLVDKVINLSGNNIHFTDKVVQ